MKRVTRTLGLASASLGHALRPSVRRAGSVSRRGRNSQERSRRERDATQHYLDVVDVMVLVLNADATVKLINRRGCSILGYDAPRDIVGKSWIDVFIPHRMREAMRETFRQLISGEVTNVEHYTTPVVTRMSASANDWLAPETLTRLCTVPVIGVLEAAWDLGPYAMESRILRPLLWFGLLEQRREKGTGLVGRHLYRKTPLFDRFVKFNVRIEGPATRH
jgi:PAS domain S-box-containing protein